MIKMSPRTTHNAGGLSYPHQHVVMMVDNYLITFFENIVTHSHTHEPTPLRGKRASKARHLTSDLNYKQSRKGRGASCV